MKKNYPLLLLILLCFCVNFFAQTRNTQVVDPKRESARATLKTFMNAFKQPRIGVSPDPIEEAVKCLDLQAFPNEYKQIKGVEIASELLEIIDSVENFHVEDAPETINGEPFRVYQSQIGEIIIAKTPSGEWLFTQETVRSIPLIMVSVNEQNTTHGSATLTNSESVGSQIRDNLPAVLKQPLLGLERWQWLGLFALFIIAAIIGQFVKIIISWTLGRILRQRYETLTDENIKILYAPIGLLAFVTTFRIGLRALALTQGSIGFLRTILFILTAAAIVWLAYRIVDAVATRLQKRALETKQQSDDLLVPFLSAIVRIGIVVIGLIVVAENLNFNVTGLIAGLGIGGIAIALASQATLSNFFGSLVLMIERPFMAEDRISVNGIQGTVKEVGLRSTKILTQDDSLVTVPNSSIVNANIVNEGVQNYRNWVLNLAVSQQNGIEKIKQFSAGIEEIIKTGEFLNNEIFKIHIYDMTFPSLVLRIEVNFKTDNFDFELKARQQFITEVLLQADKSGIQMEAVKK
jgi:MscS family membrane protein